MALSKLTVLNDKYVLRKVLGSQGPYDVTYLAWNLSKERNAVVVREYNPSFIVKRTHEGTRFEYKHDEAQDHFDYGLNCFVREAAAAALIDHPNVVKHEDYFRENDTSYCVSTFHPGATLSKVLEGNQGKIEKRAAYAIIMPLLDGLLAGHRQGLIHGRLSPGQIFLTKTGRPLLFRFHVTRILLARRCGRVQDMNDYGYTAPELLVPNGKKGPWSDIYSCGATLYSIITGNKPPDSLLRRERDPFLDTLHNEKEISPGLKKVIYRAMSVIPEDRPQSILEFKQELMNGMLGSGKDYNHSRKDAPDFSRPFSLENATALEELAAQEEADDPDVIYGEQSAFPDSQPSYAPQKKAYNGGGDGFSSPVRAPFIESDGPGKPFVETNPLGPFASENLSLQTRKKESLLQTLTTPAPEVFEIGERIHLKKLQLPGKIPIIGGIGVLAIIASIWLSGALLKTDSEGRDTGLNGDIETVLPASANQSTENDLLNDEFTASVPGAVADSFDGVYPNAQSVAPFPTVAPEEIAESPVDQGIRFVQQADSLFERNNFDQARNVYVLALKYPGVDQYADSMITVVEDAIAAQAKRQQVQRYMLIAQNLIKDQNYSEARRAYERALTVIPDDSGILRQIDSLNKLVETADEQEKQYLYLIGQGDGLFADGSYQAALNSYQKALELKEDDAYLVEQIAKSQDSLNAIAEKAKSQQDLFTFHKDKADSLFAKSDFENAAVHYKAALAQNPEDSYVLDQLVAAQQGKQELLNRIMDERGIFVVTDTPPKLIDEVELIKQVRYPILAERRNIEGRVVMKMIIDEEGIPSEIEVLQGIGYGCDSEAVRVLENARFEPGKHMGKVVKTWHTYAVTFKLLR